MQALTSCQMLSNPTSSRGKHYIRGDHWWLLLDCRDRRASTETGAAVPGTPKLLSLFHDVLLLLETPNKHPEYTAPGLLNDPLNLRCDVTVWVLILAGLTKYPNHFLQHKHCKHRYMNTIKKGMEENCHKLPLVLSLAAPLVSIMTIRAEAVNRRVVTMTTLLFQWLNDSICSFHKHNRYIR